MDILNERIVKGAELDERMRSYEDSSRVYLPRRLPLIVRVDGRAFHTLTAHMRKPWDLVIHNAMVEVAAALMKEAQGAKLAYAQSDEVSVLLTDYDALNTEAWFGKNLQKIVSVSASVAALAFNHGSLSWNLEGAFDARAFVLPKEEVANYFIWRQRDCERNSIQGLAQAHFPHKHLHGLNTSQLQDKLMSEASVNWNDCEPWQKRGTVVLPGPAIDDAPPRFTASREYIERFVWLPDDS